MAYRSQEEVDEIVRLWNDGESAAQIGRRYNCSRNAIIGVIHRLRDSRKVLRHGPSSTRTPRHPVPRERFVDVRPRLLKKPPVDMEEPTVLGPLNDFPPPSTCRWTNDDVAKDFRFCGHPVIKEGVAWCPFHDKKVKNTGYIPQRLRA